MMNSAEMTRQLEDAGNFVVRWELVSSIPRCAGPLLVWDGFYDCARIAQTNAAGEAFEGDWDYEVPATHWMPLPPPPKAKAVE